MRGGLSGDLGPPITRFVPRQSCGKGDQEQAGQDRQIDCQEHPVADSPPDRLAQPDAAARGGLLQPRHIVGFGRVRALQVHRNHGERLRRGEPRAPGALPPGWCLCAEFDLGKR